MTIYPHFEHTSNFPLKSKTVTFTHLLCLSLGTISKKYSTRLRKSSQMLTLGLKIIPIWTNLEFSKKGFTTFMRLLKPNFMQKN